MQDQEGALREQIAALTAEAAATDAAEDAAHGPDTRGDELPAEIAAADGSADEDRRGESAAGSPPSGRGSRRSGRTPEEGRQRRRVSSPFARDFRRAAGRDAQDNFTDPESRIMKTAMGFDQCYNGARWSSPKATQLIVATGLT